MKSGRGEMEHLNGDLLCAVDTETTGLRAGYHEVVQIAIVPLESSFRQHREIDPFILLLRPDHPNRMDPEAMRINGLGERCMKYGLDSDMGLQLFYEWFEKLPLAKTGTDPFHKRIAPLATNWAFDKSFLTEWFRLDENHKPYIDGFFNYAARDLARVIQYLNDVAFMNGVDTMFKKTRLTYVCTQLGVEHPNKHDALGDAIATAQCYRKLCSLRLASGIDFAVADPTEE